MTRAVPIGAHCPDVSFLLLPSPSLRSEWSPGSGLRSQGCREIYVRGRGAEGQQQGSLKCKELWQPPSKGLDPPWGKCKQQKCKGPTALMQLAWVPSARPQPAPSSRMQACPAGEGVCLTGAVFGHGIHPMSQHHLQAIHVPSRGGQVEPVPKPGRHRHLPETPPHPPGARSKESPGCPKPLGSPCTWKQNPFP